MGDVADELGESLSDRLIKQNSTDVTMAANRTNVNMTTTTDSMLNHLLDLDSDDEFSVHTLWMDEPCRSILWHPIHSGGNVRLWDLLVLIPNLLFLILLVSGCRSARRKLQSTNSPIFAAFYSLVLTNTGVSVIRCLVSMVCSAVTSPAEGTTTADKLLWIILRFFLLATEMSVVVFGVASGHLDSKKSIRLVVLVSAFISFFYSMLQCVLEFHNDVDVSFDVVQKPKVFTHGGSLFWMVSSLVFALLYISLVLLPILPCKKFLSLPNKRSFYYYVGLMAALNGLQWAGSLELFCGVASGLCLVNLTTFLYYTFFTPVVYFTFLGPFFKAADPTPAFSYKAQVDDLEEEMLNNSLQFSMDEANSTPIIINGGYLRLDADRVGLDSRPRI